MYIYKISLAIEDSNRLTYVYDYFDSHIIASHKPCEAKKLAAEKAADEGREVWSRAKVTLVGRYIGEEVNPFILLSSFNAG